MDEVTISIGMRAADAVTFFEEAATKARQAGARDGAMEIDVTGESNGAIAIGNRWYQGPVVIRFNNDDMERDEMADRTIVGVE